MNLEMPASKACLRDALLYRIVPTFPLLSGVTANKRAVVDFNTAGDRPSCNCYGKEPLQLHYLTHRQD
jgi:hypothetical protein